MLWDLLWSKSKSPKCLVFHLNVRLGIDKSIDVYHNHRIPAVCLQFAFWRNKTKPKQEDKCWDAQFWLTLDTSARRPVSFTPQHGAPSCSQSALLPCHCHPKKEPYTKRNISTLLDIDGMCNSVRIILLLAPRLFYTTTWGVLLFPICTASLPLLREIIYVHKTWRHYPLFSNCTGLLLP